jgi:hypothetical protein
MFRRTEVLQKRRRNEDARLTYSKRRQGSSSRLSLYAGWQLDHSATEGAVTEDSVACSMPRSSTTNFMPL